MWTEYHGATPKETVDQFIEATEKDVTVGAHLAKEAVEDTADELMDHPEDIIDWRETLWGLWTGTDPHHHGH